VTNITDIDKDTPVGMMRESETTDADQMETTTLEDTASLKTSLADNVTAATQQMSN
jgi:hypothetical protein